MVHLRLEVAAAPEAPAQPVALSLSADKFQVLLAGKKAQLYLERLGASQIPPDCCLTASLFPGRTEAGPGPDELPGLRRECWWKLLPFELLFRTLEAWPPGSLAL